jgi:hypothetical protein
MHNDLFLLLQPQHHIHRNLEHTRHNIRRRERKPLRERDIRHALRLVDLDEREVLRRRCVFDVMAYARCVSIDMMKGSMMW